MEKNNKISPQFEEKEVKNDSFNPLIKSFIEEFEKYSIQIPRTEKLIDIDEDYEELEALSDRLPDTTRPTMKPSLAFKILRTFDQQAIKFPKVYPVDTRKGQVQVSVVDSLKDRLFEDAGVDEVWTDILNGFKAEGTVFVQIGFDDRGDYIPVEKCDLAEVYFDSTMETLATSSGRRGKTIKTIIRTVAMSYGDFIGAYPDFEGIVSPGSPSSSTDLHRDVFNITDSASFRAGDQDKVTIHYAYSIQDQENPVMITYAGGSSTIIEKYEGKDYPFWVKKSNKKDEAFLPFIDFHFSTVKRGFYSPSIMGIMKDATRAYERMLRSALPVFAKSVNPMMLLLGSTDEREIEEMQIASEMQDMGVSQMIPVRDGTRIESVAPRNIFGEFDSARTVVFRDLSMRFDINIQALEEQDQTATESVGKVKTELKAISGLYSTNKHGFNRLAKYMFSLFVRYAKNDDERVIDVPLGEDGEEIEIDSTLILEVAKGWSGEFETETDLKVPVSTQDKVQALNELSAEATNVFYGRQFQSTEEIRLEIDSLYKKAVMRDLDDVYSMPKLIEKANAMIKSRMPQQPPIAQQPVGGKPEGEQNEDIARELSPQRALSEEV